MESFSYPVSQHSRYRSNFGAILGMLYGPAAYLWIVLGCIFGGAVHDYMSGMISLRKNGASLPEIIGDELGSNARFVMRVFTIILMLLVGAVLSSPLPAYCQA